MIAVLYTIYATQKNPNPMQNIKNPQLMTDSPDPLVGVGVGVLVLLAVLDTTDPLVEDDARDTKDEKGGRVTPAFLQTPTA